MQMPNEHTLEARVMCIIADQLGTIPLHAHRVKRLDEDMGADYIDLNEITLALESEFAIELAEEGVAKALTVQDFIELTASVYAKTHGEYRAAPENKRI